MNIIQAGLVIERAIILETRLEWLVTLEERKGISSNHKVALDTLKYVLALLATADSLRRIEHQVNYHSDIEDKISTIEKGK